MSRSVGHFLRRPAPTAETWRQLDFACPSVRHIWASLNIDDPQYQKENRCSEEWKASCPSFSCVCRKIKGCCFRYAALFEIGMHSAISSQGPICLVGLLQAQKLAQGNVIILNIHSPFPEDGEPWIQKPGCLEITHQEQFETTFLSPQSSDQPWESCRARSSPGSN